MKDKTPIKIIAIVVIPLVLALLVRFTTWDGGGKSKEGSKKKEGVDLLDLNDGPSPSVVISWLLPKDLLEVSGIAWMDADHFACVQDELGKVFIYNVRLNKIDKEIPFGPDGDYEGIAVTEESIYVLRADGVIFGIENYKNDKQSVKMYKTALGKKQDSESLAYDQKNNRLLVAVKAIDPGSADYKGIYAFDLKTKTMDKTPVYKIELNDPIFKDVSKGKPENSISPSDLGINPLNGNIYVLEGTKPKLLVMNPQGKLLSLYKLDKDNFPQPEGLSFSPDGKMYISNEGNKKDGNILQVDVIE